MAICNNKEACSGGMVAATYSSRVRAAVEMHKCKAYSQLLQM